MTESAEDTKPPSLEELVDGVRAAIAEVKGIPLDDVGPDSTFEELEVDSLDAIEMLFMVEERLDVNIPDEAARDIRDVRQVATVINALLRGKIPAAPLSDGARPGDASANESATDGAG